MLRRLMLPSLFFLAAAVAPDPALAQPAPVGTEFQINTYTTDYQFGARVAMDPAGRFVVTWYSKLQDGDGVGVFAQAYDSSGAPAGSEFQVNTYTMGNQSEPRVAADAAGDFVIAWTSSGQDGDSGGIFAQRFEIGRAHV